jgi:hypothetical protein
MFTEVLAAKQIGAALVFELAEQGGLIPSNYKTRIRLRLNV